MNNIECPYCKTPQKIDHDDDYGFDDCICEQKCYYCKNIFALAEKDNLLDYE